MGALSVGWWGAGSVLEDGLFDLAAWADRWGAVVGVSTHLR